MSAPDAGRLEWANTLRGVAALLVVIAHLAGAFFFGLFSTKVGYPVPPALPTWPVAQWMADLPIDLGALGVSLFFLISGLVIAKSLDKYSRAGFAVARALRILPTFAAVYVLVELAVALVRSLQGGSYPLEAGRTAMGAFPGLPTLLQSPGPSLGIEWTLIIELTFYVVCLLPFRRLTQGPWWVPAMAATAVVAQTILVHATWLAEGPLAGLRLMVIMFCVYLPILLVGVTVATGLGRRQLAQILALAIVYVFLSMTSDPPLTNESRLSVLAAIPLFLLAAAYGHHWRAHRITSFLADVSYPLYLLHILIGSLAMYVLALRGFSAPVIILCGVAVSMTCAWLFHIGVEVPTHRLGQHLARERFPSAPPESMPRSAAEVSPTKDSKPKVMDT